VVALLGVFRITRSAAHPDAESGSGQLHRSSTNRRCSACAGNIAAASGDQGVHLQRRASAGSTFATTMRATRSAAAMFLSTCASARITISCCCCTLVPRSAPIWRPRPDHHRPFLSFRKRVLGGFLTTSPIMHFIPVSIVRGSAAVRHIQENLDAPPSAARSPGAPALAAHHPHITFEPRPYVRGHSNAPVLDNPASSSLRQRNRHRRPGGSGIDHAAQPDPAALICPMRPRRHRRRRIS